MLYFLGIFVILVANAAFAEEPLVCDPREQPEVCQLKVQRNEALDAQAIAVGKAKRAEAVANATAEFWRKYLEGIEAQRKEAAASAETHAAWAASAAKGRVR